MSEVPPGEVRFAHQTEERREDHEGRRSLSKDSEDRTGRLPRVGIGMPVFNGEEYLPQALDALLTQTFTDFELVISDNGSTDGTREICQARATRDRRVRYVRYGENRGAAWNFNNAFELARGAYFKWAAADDICLPELVERCVAVLDARPEVVCCHSRTRKIDRQGEVLDQLPDPTDGGADLLAGERRPDASSTSVSRRFADVLLHVGWGERSFGLMRELLQAGYITVPAGADGRVISLTPPLNISVELLDGFVDALQQGLAAA